MVIHVVRPNVPSHQAYGIYSVRKRRFRYATAGHHAPIYLSAGETVIEEEKAAFPIGIVENPDYEEQIIDMEPGGRLFLYSDGMIDAECSYEGPFGKPRLIKMMQCTRRYALCDSVTKTVERVRDWSSTARLEDDASLLALEIK